MDLLFPLMRLDLGKLLRGAAYLQIAVVFFGGCEGRSEWTSGKLRKECSLAP